MPEIDKRNLPAPVLERLAAAKFDTRKAGLEVVKRGSIVEGRTFSIGELRFDEETGAPIVDGYATVYDYPYGVAGGAPYGWSEQIAAGACAKSVAQRDDVRFLINHDGLALARTKSGTLTLASDDIGLRCATNELDMANPKVAELASVLKRKDADEMSFAFRALRQEWNDDYTERRILEVQLFDVSVVTYPANPAASAQLRADEPPAPAGMSLAYARALAS